MNHVKIVLYFSSSLSWLLFMHIEAPVWMESEWGRLEEVFARAQSNVTHFKAEKISFHFLLSQNQRLESMGSNTFLFSHQSRLQHLKPPDGRFNALVRCSNLEVSQIQDFYSCPKYIYFIEAIQYTNIFGTQCYAKSLNEKELCSFESHSFRNIWSCPKYIYKYM